MEQQGFAKHNFELLDGSTEATNKKL